MNRTKLSGLLTFLFVTSVFLSSCDKDEVPRFYNAINLPMSAGQVYPPSTATSAGGSIDANYDREKHLLTYKLTWIGLSGAPTAIHLHGVAEPGYPALPGGNYVNGIVQGFTTGLPTGTSAVNGTFSQTLTVDGGAIREEDLLAGKFYFDIHTAARPNGEIRGQLLMYP